MGSLRLAMAVPRNWLCLTQRPWPRVGQGMEGGTWYIPSPAFTAITLKSSVYPFRTLRLSCDPLPPYQIHPRLTLCQTPHTWCYCLRESSSISAPFVWKTPPTIPHPLPATIAIIVGNKGWIVRSLNLALWDVTRSNFTQALKLYSRAIKCFRNISSTIKPILPTASSGRFSNLPALIMEYFSAKTKISNHLIIDNTPYIYNPVLLRTPTAGSPPPTISSVPSFTIYWCLRFSPVA